MYFNKGGKIKYKKGFSTFSNKDKYIFMGMNIYIILIFILKLITLIRIQLNLEY